MKPVIILIAALAALTGCKTDPEETTKKENQITLGPNTFITEQSSLQNLSAVTENSLTFSASDAFTSSLATGAIVVSGPTEAAPNGFIRRVTSVEQSGGGTIVSTENASIAEAFESADFTVSKDLSIDDIEDATVLVDGVMKHLTKAEIGHEFKHSFVNVPIVPGMAINGSISAEPKLTLTVVVDYFEVVSALVRFDIKEELNLSVVSSAEIPTFTAEKKFASISLRPITFTVGIVPIVIKPNINFYLGVNGEIKAKVSTGFSQKIEAFAGMEYKNGAWQGIRGFTKFFGFYPPTLEAEAKIRVYEKNEIEFLLYDLVGPSALVTLYGQFEAKGTSMSTEEDCLTWDLKLGIDGGIGFNMEALGPDFENKSLPDLIQYSAVIASSDECVPVGAGTCGDGVKNGEEECDVEDFGTTTCEGLGYDAEGTLFCDVDCTYILDFCILCGSCNYETRIQNHCARMDIYGCSNEPNYDECVSVYTMALDEHPLCGTQFEAFYYCREELEITDCYCGDGGLVWCEGGCVENTWNALAACLDP